MELQFYRLLCYLSNLPSKLLPQGLCTGVSLSPGSSSFPKAHNHFLSPSRSLPKCHLLRKIFLFILPETALLCKPLSIRFMCIYYFLHLHSHVYCVSSTLVTDTSPCLLYSKHSINNCQMHETRTLEEIINSGTY